MRMHVCVCVWLVRDRGGVWYSEGRLRSHLPVSACQCEAFNGYRPVCGLWLPPACCHCRWRLDSWLKKPHTHTHTPHTHTQRRRREGGSEYTRLFSLTINLQDRQLIESIVKHVRQGNVHVYSIWVVFCSNEVSLDDSVPQNCHYCTFLWVRASSNCRNSYFHLLSFLLTRKPLLTAQCRWACLNLTEARSNFSMCLSGGNLRLLRQTAQLLTEPRWQRIRLSTNID